MDNDMKYYAIDRIYSLCNRKQYFTSGTCSQYDKLFYMVKKDEQFSVRDVALAIWLCSKDADLQEIQADLEEIQKEINDMIDAKEQEERDQRAMEETIYLA